MCILSMFEDTFSLSIAQLSIHIIRIPYTRGGRKISGLFMLPSFHVQLPTHIIHERKLHFIAYKSVSLFSMRSPYTGSFEVLGLPWALNWRNIDL